MKKIYILVTTMLLSICLNAQTTIAAQGFEGSVDDTWSFTTTPETYEVGNDIWAIVTAIDDISAADTGSNFWGIRDIENSNGGGAFDHILDFPNMSVAGESNILLTFKYYSNGFDSTDELSVEYFFDDVSQGIEPLSKDTDAWTIYSKVVPDGTTNVSFKLIGLQNGGSDYAGFDTILLQSGANTTPSLTITSPTDGSIANAGSDGFNVEIELLTFTLSGDDGSGASDNTGDGYIQYSVDSGAFINKFDIDAIELMGLASGPHTVSVRLVDNNGTLLGFDDTVNFTVNDIIQTLPMYESFDYTVAENLGDQPNWINQNSGDEVLIGSGSLSYSGLADSAGNHIMFNGDGADPRIEFTPVTTEDVFVSFILNVADQSAITDLNDGGYFAVLGEFDARVWVRPNPDASGITYDIGIGATASSPPVTSETYNIGENVLIIMSYNIDTDTVNAWVNPTSAELQQGNPPATTTITDVAVDDASFISEFTFRQDSNGETPSILLDELRIGRSWAEVTPTSLSNDEFITNSFNVSPNPTSTGFVNITSTNSNNIDIIVYDILGKKVKNEVLKNNQLNVSDLKAGVYLLKISQNNTSVTKKLVVK